MNSSVSRIKKPQNGLSHLKSPNGELMKKMSNYAIFNLQMGVDIDIHLSSTT